VFEAVQQRLDQNCRRCAWVVRQLNIPFGTPQNADRCNALPSSAKTLLRVATEMALHVLAYNLARASWTSSALSRCWRQ